MPFCGGRCPDHWTASYDGAIARKVRANRVQEQLHSSCTQAHNKAEEAMRKPE